MNTYAISARVLLPHLPVNLMLHQLVSLNHAIALTYSSMVRMTVGQGSDSGRN